MGDTSDESIPNCNEMLLEAVRNRNLEEVDRLLQHPHLDVNYDIGDGCTILFESLYIKDETIFLNLVNAGFDINLRNVMQETPLHTAVIYSPINFVYELIKRGVDINAQEQCKHTPLSHAAFHGELDALCMLLYYGVDVNLVCSESRTPLMWALENDHVEISKILFNYYDDFSQESLEGATALHFAIRAENPIAMDILNLHTNKSECETLLRMCLENNNNTFFNLILTTFEQEAVVDETFLLHYVSVCRFPTSQWLESLYLMFSVAKISLEPVSVCKWNVFSKLFFCFHKRSIDLHDRMALIYLFLSCGVKITIEDVNSAYLHYGLNDVLEAFVHAFNYKQSITANEFLPLPRFFFMLEHNYQVDIISPVFQYLLDNGNITAIADDIREGVIINSLGFCSLSPFKKQMIAEVPCNKCQNIVERLNAIPEFPSLFELCRNRTRQLIKQRCSINKSYQFHTIVRKLNLPPVVKDIICFKTNIY